MFGILECTSKSRVQGTGLPFRPYGSNEVLTINSKKHKETHVDQWAKVHETTRELMEVIGPIGEYETECLVLRQMYGVGCKYPSHGIFPSPSAQDTYHAITVDGPTTLDRDDAISVVETEEGFRVGVHITDLTRRLPLAWLEWTKSRVSSAYWETGTKPMLPPLLAHGELSLNAGKSYPCISAFFYYDKKYQYIRMEWDTTSSVYIDSNKTYDQLETYPYVDVLHHISGTSDPTEVIAWLMIKYNLEAAAFYPNVLLRVQEEEDTVATYSYDGTHASMNGKVYGHFTSPIRRYADFYNQCVIQGFFTYHLDETSLNKVNQRMEQLRQFHYRETIMSLAYRCKTNPMIVEAMITKSEDGRSIQLVSKELEKKVWIPLHDTYYEEEICGQLTESQQFVELFGLHKGGRATLRIRII